MTFVSRGLWLIGNILLIGLIVVAAVVGIASPISNNVLVPLGTWNTFPNPCYAIVIGGQIQCPGYAVFQNGVEIEGPGTPCTVTSLSNITTGSANGDLCQLFNQPYYSQVYPADGQTHTFGFQVNCVSPALATNAGSVIYIQYANYTFNNGSQIWQNTSNWIIPNNSQSIYIDREAGWDCPRTLFQNSGGSLPALTGAGGGPTGYAFRAVGVCGCGSGNPPSANITGGNPIIQSVTVSVNNPIQPTIGANIVGTPSTTSFRYQGFVNFLASASTIVDVQWIATNSTGTCGVANKCVESGVTASGCTIAVGSSKCTSSTITYPSTFTGTVHVVLTSKTLVPSTVPSVASDLPLFSTQIIKA